LDGRDLRSLRLADLRRQVALVPQEPFLFPASVAANVAYGRPGASRAEVEAAPPPPRAAPVRGRPPGSRHTPPGGRGGTPAGGGGRRRAGAGALLRAARVLVLDEPTSALDAETERALLETLRRLMRGRTTLLIAHRLSTARAADRIAVLDGGRVAEL